jgi:hypothetical protein
MPIVDRLGGNPSEQSFSIHAEHEDAFRRFVESVNQNARKMVVGLVAFLVVLMAVPIAVSLLEAPPWIADAGIGACIAAFGATLVRFPFATPETVQLMGVKRSIITVRVLACGMVAFGLAMMLSLV